MSLSQGRVPIWPHPQHLLDPTAKELTSREGRGPVGPRPRPAANERARREGAGAATPHKGSVRGWGALPGFGVGWVGTRGCRRGRNSGPRSRLPRKCFLPAQTWLRPCELQERCSAIGVSGAVATAVEVQVPASPGAAGGSQRGAPACVLPELRGASRRRTPDGPGAAGPRPRTGLGGRERWLTYSEPWLLSSVLTIVWGFAGRKLRSGPVRRW